MKWEMSLSTPNKEVYELWNDGQKLLSVDVHPFTNSARIEYAAERRVFLIRREGFLRNKIVLCNEYGIRLAQMPYESGENVIHLNEERFTYTIENKVRPQFSIFRELNYAPLVVCQLNIDKETGDNGKRHKAVTESVQSILLLALCWYMFKPVGKHSNLPELV